MTQTKYPKSSKSYIQGTMNPAHKMPRIVKFSQNMLKESWYIASRLVVLIVRGWMLDGAGKDVDPILVIDSPEDDNRTCL